MSDNETPEVNSDRPGAAPGARLRAERERRGLSLVQVAGEMHMDTAVAEALEAERFDTLGAPIFVRGHLRNYARLLGLNEDEIVAEYERLGGGETPRIVPPKPAGDVMTGSPGGHRWVALVGWLLVLALAGLLGLWLYHGGFGKLLATGQTPSTPAGQSLSASQPLQTPGEPSAAQPSRSAKSGGSVAAQTEETATVGAAPGEQTPVAQSVDQAGQAGRGETGQSAARTSAQGDDTRASESAPPAAAGPEPAPAADTRLTLQLQFKNKSWVEVYNADNQPLLYDLLPAGAQKTLKAEPPVRLFFGDARGVSLSVNGKAYDVAVHERDDHTARFTVKSP